MATGPIWIVSLCFAINKVFTQKKKKFNDIYGPKAES